jgi:hypothetical protein
MTAFVLLATLTAQAQPPTAETEKPGVVRGTVVSAATKEPLRRADVTLFPTTRGMAGGGGFPGMMAGPAGSLKAATDNEGNFVFASVPPGTYSLSVQRTGYVALRYGARNATSPGTNLTVRAGQEIAGLRMEMIPQGIIAGRVLDEEGEPLQGVVVFAMSGEASVPAGQRPRRGRGMGMTSQAQTDDRGEFRVANLTPGKYFLQVMPGRWGGMPIAAPTNEGGEEMGYVTTYHPGVTDPAQAARIDVAAGAEVSGIDIRLKRIRVFRVRGKVLDPSGEPGKNYFVNVMPKGMFFGPLVSQQFHRLPDGGFELRNVAPGSYRLVVQSNPGRGDGLTYVENLEVGSQNVDGLVLRLQPPVTVTGTVLQPSETKLDLNNMRVMLQGDVPMMQRSGPPPVKDDGTFEVENVPPGRYRLMLNAPPGGYIESIRYGDLDVTGSEFDVTASPAPIRAVVRPGGGAVSGVVLLDGKPASGLIYLIPADAALRNQQTVRSAIPDQNGVFTVGNIRPGDYLVFALSESDWGIWDDPDDFRAIESKAKKVSLKDTSKETVELTIAK